MLRLEPGRHGHVAAAGVDGDAGGLGDGDGEVEAAVVVAVRPDQHGGIAADVTWAASESKIFLASESESA